MSRKRVALSVLTPLRRRPQQKRSRHNDDIHDEDVENQQPSPHPMSLIILPQAFRYAPNTFKSICHIGTMNNTSYTVLNFKNMVCSMCTCPKSQYLSLDFFFNLYFRTLSENPSETGRPGKSEIKAQNYTVKTIWASPTSFE